MPREQQPKPGVLDFFCTRQEKDQTIASVLKKRLGLSWTRVRNAIAGRYVRIGGQIEADSTRRVRPGLRVSISTHILEQSTVTDVKTREAKYRRKGKEKVKVEPVVKKVEKPKPKQAPKKVVEPAPKKPTPVYEIDIVYADDSIVIVNKPAGLTTMRHKEEAEEFGEGKRFLPKTLADLLPALLGLPSQKLHAVHRIDRDTSGLVAFARNKKVAKDLIEQFRRHSAEREYLALTRGIPSSHRIQSSLVRDRGDGRRGSGEGEDSKRAVTHVRVVERLGEFGAVSCKLETGRTHQVRIHLGEAGCPLCGERVYDRSMNGLPIPDTSGAKRPMLHAGTLGLVHPESGEPMTWTAPPPSDFSKLWSGFRDAMKK